MIQWFLNWLQKRQAENTEPLIRRVSGRVENMQRIVEEDSSARERAKRRDPFVDDFFPPIQRHARHHGKGV